MRLPLLVSVPHAGLTVPPEVRDLCALTAADILADSDEGAEAVYGGLRDRVAAFMTTPVARAVVDLNRAENDFRKDGVVKTHTCWDVPVYREPPSKDLVERLLAAYYRPYHDKLGSAAGSVRCGVDCHTMAALGPPVGPDPGKPRPAVCLSHAGFTCPDPWLASMARAFEEAFERPPSLNEPFKGGFIVRSHAAELPWVQVELSREPFMDLEEKARRVIDALTRWCRIMGWQVS
jgi:N-formylglutamate deformylase